MLLVADIPTKVQSLLPYHWSGIGTQRQTIVCIVTLLVILKEGIRYEQCTTLHRSLIPYQTLGIGRGW